MDGAAYAGVEPIARTRACVAAATESTSLVWILRLREVMAHFLRIGALCCAYPLIRARRPFGCSPGAKSQKKKTAGGQPAVRRTPARGWRWHVVRGYLIR